MERKWGRKGRSKGDNQRLAELKKDVVFKWLQKGWYTVNLELLEANAGQLSNNRFWGLVKELMPNKRQKKEKQPIKEPESRIVPHRNPGGFGKVIKESQKKSHSYPAKKLWP